MAVKIRSIFSNDILCIFTALTGNCSKNVASTRNMFYFKCQSTFNFPSSKKMIDFPDYIEYDVVFR